MRTPMNALAARTTLLASASALLAAAAMAPAAPQQAGYGYGGSAPGTTPVQPNGAPDGDQGGASAGSMGQSANGVPPGVGDNNSGGELSRADLQQQALAPEYHLHMAGPTASDAVGAGGGPALQEGSPSPGYVQAKFVHPYGNAVVTHHYGPGYPPPMGTGGGPNDGNAAGLIANGTVAGNPGLVNWGMTPAWDAEEIGNGAWFGSAGSNSSSPMPYIGGFND